MAMSQQKTTKPNWKSGPPSCSECIRLKLKCSRSWPCSSCTRRGVSHLCPAGSKEPRLSKKYQVLLQENESLKQALQSDTWTATQSDTELPDNEVALLAESSDRNVLRSSTVLLPSYTELSPESAVSLSENNFAVASGSGLGVMENDGDLSRFMGRGAAALYVYETNGEPTHEDPILPFSALVDLDNVRKLLPSEMETEQLLRSYYTNVEWNYCPTDRVAIETAKAIIYRGGLDRVSPHRLATFLMTLALGRYFVDQAPTTHDFFITSSNLLASPKTHFLWRHSLAAVECLHLMTTYLLFTGSSASSRAAWPVLRLCMTLAVAVGIQRDARKWGQDQSALERRERLWWECWTYDMLQCLNFGRPYAVPAHMVDCPLPAKLAAGLYVESDNDFHDFKYQLALGYRKIIDCLASPVLPNYDVVLALDTELRGIEASAPDWLKWSERDLDVVEQGSSGGIHHQDVKRGPQMHQASLLMHKGLLALHRPWFAQAIVSGGEPLLNTFAASFTACICSARRHVQILASLTRCDLKAASRWWFFAFHGCTAAVIQAAALLKVPNCIMADEIRNDFALSFKTISDLAPVSAVARRALPIIRDLKEKVRMGSGRIGMVDLPIFSQFGLQPMEPNFLPDFTSGSDQTQTLPDANPAYTGFSWPDPPSEAHDPLIQSLLDWIGREEVEPQAQQNFL